MPKATRKRSAGARKARTSVGDLILKAVSASKERNGISLPTLKKLLSAKGYDVRKNKVRLKTTIKKLLTKGALVQVKGCYKIGKKVAKPKAAKRAKKPAAKKRPSARKRRSARRSKKTKRAAKRPRKSGKRSRKLARKRASKRQ